MMVGGLLGDFVKGPLTGQLPQRIEQGIALHRKIDVFVDQQPEIRGALCRFQTPYRRFAGIYLDICFDHFLAKHWKAFHQQSLEDFFVKFYEHLRNFDELLPPRALHFSKVAPVVHWLESYAEFENLELMLQRIGQRFKKQVPLHHGFFILQRDYATLESEFLLTFPQFVAFADSQRQNLQGTIHSDQEAG